MTEVPPASGSFTAALGAPGLPPLPPLPPLPKPRQGLQRQLLLSFTLFTLGVSAVLGLFAMAFVYSVEDRFIAATLSRAATEMQIRHQASGHWPTPPQAFMQRYDAAVSLPDDLRLAWQAEPHRREFPGTQGRHYHLHWLGRPDGAPPDPPVPPVPDARHPLLVAEVSELLVVRPLRGELLVWWMVGSGGLTGAALGLAAWRARRISAPLVRLADAIARSRPGDSSTRPTPFALDHRDDEVGLLARHLDALTARTRSFIHREQVFTRDVSHELRTPLAVLGMASERMLGRNDLPPEVAAQLQQMRQVLWDLEQTVNTLLALAREAHAPAMSAAVAGGVSVPMPRDMAPATAPITLAVLPLLERVVLEQMSRLQGKDIQLEIDVSPALRLDLPPGVLHILLSNLVGNAFSHCEPGPVRLSADAEGLQLHNRSQALPAGLSERLGQPFQKGAASAGLGLGLAIVHRLAEHQGLQLSLGQADGNTRVQLLWAAKAWLALPAGSASA